MEENNEALLNPNETKVPTIEDRLNFAAVVISRVTQNIDNMSKHEMERTLKAVAMYPMQVKINSKLEHAVLKDLIDLEANKFNIWILQQANAPKLEEPPTESASDEYDLPGVENTPETTEPTKE